MPLIDDDEKKKEIIKEAIDEWLNNQYARIGRWTIGGLVSAVIAGLAYFAFVNHGFISK